MPNNTYEEIFFVLHLILRRKLDVCEREVFFSIALHYILLGKLDVCGREVLSGSENMVNLLYIIIQFFCP